MQKDYWSNFINFTQPKNTRRYSTKIWKPLFPQMETTQLIFLHRKSLNNEKFGEKFEFSTKFFDEVSCKSHSAKNPKDSSMLGRRFVSSKNLGGVGKNKLEKSLIEKRRSLKSKITI